MDEPDPPRRKDRLVQTRVPRDLESTLKHEARRRRLTVSHLIRNILEDTFQLVDDVVANVDDIVNDSVELARRVQRDARRVAGAVRGAAGQQEDRRTRSDPSDAPDIEPATGGGGVEAAPAPGRHGDPLAHVYAWNGVVTNRAERCTRCSAGIARGGEAWVGLSDDPRGPRAWLCPACRVELAR